MMFASIRMPLPEPIVGKHHPNELDRHLLLMRKKYMKQISHKCEKLPSMEFKAVLKEFETFSSMLNQLEQEVSPSFS